MCDPKAGAASGVAAPVLPAERYYRALCLPSLGIPAVCLPSTSPANAAYTLPRLLEAWQIIQSGAGETPQ